MIDFSLIVATLGRSIELKPLLNSLCNQSHSNFELILVDQNKDDRLEPVLSSYSPNFPVEHIKSEKGISRARNIGIKKARGKVVGFPDDDCWYPIIFLETLLNQFSNNPEIDGFTGRVINECGNNLGRYANEPGYLTRYNVWERTSAVSMFLKISVLYNIGGFDEQMGIGGSTKWQGAEDVDLPIRAIEHGYQIYFDPKIIVYHPAVITDDLEKWYLRAFNYGAGIGHVWSKHHYPNWLVGYYLLRPLLGTMVSLVRVDLNKARYYWNSFRGRLYGWKSQG